MIRETFGTMTREPYGEEARYVFEAFMTRFGYIEYFIIDMAEKDQNSGQFGRVIVQTNSKVLAFEKKAALS